MKRNLLKVFALVFTIGLVSLNVGATEKKVEFEAYISNYANAETEMMVVEGVENGQLGYNEEFIPRDTSNYQFQMIENPTYGFVYHHAEITFKDGREVLARFDKNFILSDYISEDEIDTVDTVVFYYSNAGQVKVSYKVNDVNGKELDASQVLKGRYESKITNNDGSVFNFPADSFVNAKKDFSGYKFIKMVGSDNTDFINGEKNVTYIYEKIKTVDPVKPVKPKPVKPKPNKEKPAKKKSNKKEIAKAGQENNALLVSSLLISVLGSAYFVSKKINI
ncbi:MAG: MucBP domain-containing protein [Erysipelotrichales bacterium]